jgi:hypothetical protein
MDLLKIHVDLQQFGTDLLLVNTDFLVSETEKLPDFIAGCDCLRPLSGAVMSVPPSVASGSLL